MLAHLQEIMEYADVYGWKCALVWNRSPIFSKSAPNMSTMACQTTKAPEDNPRNPYFSSPLRLVTEHAMHSTSAHAHTISPIPMSYTAAGIVSPLFSISADTPNNSVEEKGCPQKTGWGVSKPDYPQSTGYE